jgi:hypothetical protein
VRTRNAGHYCVCSWAACSCEAKWESNRCAGIATRTISTAATTEVIAVGYSLAPGLSAAGCEHAACTIFAVATPTELPPCTVRRNASTQFASFCAQAHPFVDAAAQKLIPSARRTSDFRLILSASSLSLNRSRIGRPGPSFGASSSPGAGPVFLDRWSERRFGHMPLTGHGFWCP